MVVFSDYVSGHCLGDSIVYKPQIRRDGGSTLYVNAHTTGTTNDGIYILILVLWRLHHE